MIIFWHLQQETMDIQSKRFQFTYKLVVSVMFFSMFFHRWDMYLPISWPIWALSSDVETARPRLAAAARPLDAVLLGELQLSTWLGHQNWHFWKQNCWTRWLNKLRLKCFDWCWFCKSQSRSGFVPRLGHYCAHIFFLHLLTHSQHQIVWAKFEPKPYDMIYIYQ